MYERIKEYITIFLYYCVLVACVWNEQTSHIYMFLHYFQSNVRKEKKSVLLATVLSKYSRH